MTAKLIKGTEIREVILDEIKKDVAEIKEKYGVVPGLVTILVGENPASISYVTLKIKTANQLGFNEIQDSQPEDISQEDLLALVEKYNNDDSRICRPSWYQHPNSLQGSELRFDLYTIR